MKKLGKYSFGIGDRFGLQGEAQLKAFVMARQRGLEITPVWNKSEREHGIVGTAPSDVRAEADAAVKTLGWRGPYFCDADHIHLGCVERYIQPCDFFTIDVAEALRDGLEAAAAEAGRIYRRIAAGRGAGTFIAEVSMDETASPQTPDELFTMLRLLAAEEIPVQTIAPRFSGRFNKGVEYVGDPEQFGKEFEADVLVLRKAVGEFGLPASLKLSLHSGSDKFAIYPIIGKILKKHGAGIHVKTAGTTWLEEVAGLAEAGGAALAMAKRIYRQAFEHRDELTAPYAQVISVEPAKLPEPSVVDGWSAQEFVGALEHNSACPQYNPDLRQLIHVGYKVAAKLGSAYHAALKANASVIGARVTANLYDRHMRRMFEELSA
jgi:hypothetical protein